MLGEHAWRNGNPHRVRIPRGRRKQLDRILPVVVQPPHEQHLPVVLAAVREQPRHLQARGSGIR